MGQDPRVTEIAMVTPWEVRCGIATYSSFLSKALAEHDVATYIMRLNRFGHKTPQYLEHLGLRRFPKDIPIVHCQHEYGLYNQFEVSFYDALKPFFRKVKIVTTLHGIGMKQLDVVLAQRSDLVIVHNEYQQRNFDHPSVIIPHGITPRKCITSTRAKAQMDIDGPTVGCFGFISPYKGIEDILYAAKHLPEITFIIAGGYHTTTDTGYISTLKKLAAKNIVWTGYVDDKDLPRVMGAMDACIYPSTFISESGALLTLIGFGKAVIARNLPANKDKPIWTFNSKDHLVELITTILGDEAALRKAEHSAEQYAKRNTWSVVAEKHINEYNTLLNSDKYG